LNPFWLIKYRLMKNNCYHTAMDIGEALQYATLLAEDMVESGLGWSDGGEG